MNEVSKGTKECVIYFNDLTYRMSGVDQETLIVAYQ